MSAVLIVGRSAGQSTIWGAYPPDGEFGRARFEVEESKEMARGSADSDSKEASRGNTFLAM